MNSLLTGIVPILCVVGVVVVGFIGAAVRVVQEYERGVIFRLGRVQGAKGPGLFLIIPLIDRMIKVDLRTVTLDVPSQEAISADNVTVRVNAVVYYRVIDPVAAIIEVEDYNRATWQIAQTTLRNVIGQSHLDQLLSERETVNEKLQQIIDEATEPWGIKVSIVEVKDVELNPQMVRAMARQAEAERERRAKIIHAEGELQAAAQLADAARLMAEEPGAMTLRYLQTLLEIGVEQNTTTIFPVPVDILGAFVQSRLETIENNKQTIEAKKPQ
ncbi:MAG TPA: slipin family protein [Candidatus Binatia bacterium]|jgi:regulator of protease activity HflC (stomatin/prohibitin superfamily)|nr:slipin family protein [Candidatus Binatia bacterium]